MKLKLDENLGVRGKHVLDAAGHDACTVAAQKLTAADDRHLIEICRLEGRALVTLDVDFANPLVFPPADYAGIAVIRLPKRPTAADLQAAHQGSSRRKMFLKNSSLPWCWSSIWSARGRGFVPFDQ